jgi:hypothetical protein
VCGHRAAYQPAFSQSSAVPSCTLFEMEAEAKKIAKEAVEALAAKLGVK